MMDGYGITRTHKLGLGVEEPFLEFYIPFIGFKGLYTFILFHTEQMAEYVLNS